MQAQRQREHERGWLGRQTESERQRDAVQAAKESLYKNFPKTRTDTTVLDFLTLIGLRPAFLRPAIPELEACVKAALHWMDPTNIRIRVCRSATEVTKALKNGQVNLFDSFRLSGAGRKLIPAQEHAWKTSLGIIAPFTILLHENLQTSFIRSFGKELGPSYELDYFSFVAFETWLLLLAETPMRPHLFVQLFSLFCLGNHIPGLTADGTVLVLVR